MYVLCFSQEKVEILRSECEEMKRREQEYLDAFQRDSDSKVQVSQPVLIRKVKKCKCDKLLCNYVLYELMAAVCLSTEKTSIKKSGIRSLTVLCLKMFENISGE